MKKFYENSDFAIYTDKKNEIVDLYNKVTNTKTRFIASFFIIVLFIFLIFNNIYKSENNAAQKVVIVCVSINKEAEIAI